MDVRLDAGSEVHALDADGFLRRLGLGDALSGDVEGRPVFGRRDGVVTGYGEDEGHETIPCPFFLPEGQCRERTRSPTPNLRPFGGVLYAISEGGNPALLSCFWPLFFRGGAG